MGWEEQSGRDEEDGVKVKGSVMFGRQRNAMTRQSLRHSREPVLVLCWVLGGGRCTSGPCGGRKEGPQGRNGSVNPLALRRRGTIIKP